MRWMHADRRRELAQRRRNVGQVGGPNASALQLEAARHASYEACVGPLVRSGQDQVHVAEFVPEVALLECGAV
jgi:hypothetical protein